MQYISKNVSGRWFSIPISDETVIDARRATFNENKEIIDHIKTEMKDYTEKERSDMFNLLAQHLHFKIENMVDEKIQNNEVDVNNIQSI